MWQRRIKYSMLNRVAKKVYAQSFYAQSCFTAFYMKKTQHDCAQLIISIAPGFTFLPAKNATRLRLAK
jgi:uncharacterized cysteine cluster protein YcgN (CxxCxxCC family)